MEKPLVLVREEMEWHDGFFKVNLRYAHREHLPTYLTYLGMK